MSMVDPPVPARQFGVVCDGDSRRYLGQRIYCEISQKSLRMTRSGAISLMRPETPSAAKEPRIDSTLVMGIAPWVVHGSIQCRQRN